MRSISLALITTLTLADTQSQACLFNNLDHTDLDQNPMFTLVENRPHPFPAGLFRRFANQLGEFSEDDCRNSLRRKTYRHTSGDIFTVLYTTNDECDGGNTYGLIIAGSTEGPSGVRATIEDSHIHCLY